MSDLYTLVGVRESSGKILKRCWFSEDGKICRVGEECRYAHSQKELDIWKKSKRDNQYIIIPPCDG